MNIEIKEFNLTILKIDDVTMKNGKIYFNTKSKDGNDIVLPILCDKYNKAWFENIKNEMVDYPAKIKIVKHNNGRYYIYFNNNAEIFHKYFEIQNSICQYMALHPYMYMYIDKNALLITRKMIDLTDFGGHIDAIYYKKYISSFN